MRPCHAIATVACGSRDTTERLLTYTNQCLFERQCVMALSCIHNTHLLRSAGQTSSRLTLLEMLALYHKPPISGMTKATESSIRGR
jgi:hypothetical protein